MSFFDRQDIPVAMLSLGCVACSDDDLRERFSNEGDPVFFGNPRRPESLVGNLLRNHQDQSDLDAKTYADTDFDEDVAMLHDFYLATSQSDTDSCTMHGLVQLSTKNWLERHECLDTWMNAYIGFMSISFPFEDLLNKSVRDKCHNLLPHVLKMSGLRTKSQRWLAVWVYTSNELTDFASAQGLFSMMSKNACLVFSEAKLLLGYGWLKMVVSLTMCTVLCNKGKYAEAVSLGERNIQLSKEALGENGSRTILTTIELVAALREHGDLQRALSYADTIIATCLEAQKGRNDMYLAYDAKHQVLLSMGRLDEVEKGTRPMLKWYDPENPQHLLILTLLGEALFANGKLSQTQSCCKTFWRRPYGSI